MKIKGYIVREVIGVLLVLVSVVVLASTVEAQGIGGPNSGTWTVMPPKHGFQTIYGPNFQKRRIIYHGSQGYGGSDLDGWRMFYDTMSDIRQQRLIQQQQNQIMELQLQQMEREAGLR